MLWSDRIPLSVLPWQQEPSDLRLGGVGLALGSAVGAWLEIVLLRREMQSLRADRVADLRVGGGLLWPYLGLSIAALAPAGAVAWLTLGAPMVLRGLLVVGCYAVVYLALGKVLGVVEPRDLLSGTRMAGEKSRSGSVEDGGAGGAS